MRMPAHVIFDYEQLDHAHLVRVTPVGVTREVDDVSYTLMSVEQYQAGFALVLLTEQALEPSAAAGEMPPMLSAMAAIDAADDLRQRYRGRPRAGAGGGGPSVVHTRNVYTFTPALDPRVSSLILEVSWVRRLHWHADGTPAWGDDEVVSGPITLVFPLVAPNH